jgi:hypothetical protein
MQNPGRRKLLQAGAAAGSLFLPLPYAWVRAQSDGAVRLLRLPKIALVFGNSKYKDAPLKNPANDAKAIGEALASSGFSVTTRIDASRTEMAAALDAYIKELAAKKCVGLFYYAGHGIQLAWKNYMLPVDAEIDTIDDVQKKAVEVNSLTEGLVKAANPLNVIILDACRDNPFGTAKPTQQKGLSQMDAPNQTLLAYATAPGNVASDGEGANGLYTENFLREMKVPEAKIEDVFKRVRLGVRRKSNGAQVPWESTSLEEDFWFIPPKELKKLSEAEKEKLFKEESELWARAEKATEPGPLEEYLRRYPNGNYSELAQVQLDRVLAKQGEKKVEVVSAASNPYTKGSAEVDTRYKVGDTYEYRELGLLSKSERGKFTQTITQITDSEVIYSNGFVTDLLGNTRRFPDGRRQTPNQNYPAEFIVGKRWQTRFINLLPDGGEARNELEIHIAARENITVPAGTFNAFRMEMTGFWVRTGAGISGRGTVDNKAWFAPDVVRAYVSRESMVRRQGGIVREERFELVSYKQG